MHSKIKNTENKKFTLQFNDGDILQSIIFRKNRDNFLMSMTCFIEIENNITELTQYANIQKICEFANRIIKMVLITDINNQILKFYMEKKHMNWIL